MQWKDERDGAINAELLTAMRLAWESGANAMEVARTFLHTDGNPTISTEISYDLQAGTYITAAERDPEFQRQWGLQAASLLNPFLTPDSRLLEVGAGDGTTLAAALPFVESQVLAVGATDLSWSRCWAARGLLGPTPRIWASDLFHLPLASDSVYVVFTSHALEPNGGREVEGLGELVRVARHALVLIEPIYEFADEEGQARMRHHGYVEGLAEALDELPVEVIEIRPLEITSNSLNPSGVIIALPDDRHPPLPMQAPDDFDWQCPATRTPLVDLGDCFFSPTAGIAYPSLRGIPVLRPHLAVVARGLGEVGA